MREIEGATHDDELRARLTTMRRGSPGLCVGVMHDEIRVSLPDTTHAVTYYKPEGSPQLLARGIPTRDDPRSPMSLSEFLIRAWRAANTKAKELDWIV